MLRASQMAPSLLVVTSCACVTSAPRVASEFASKSAQPPALAPIANTWELGVTGGTTLGDGEPANDMPHYGAFARYRASDAWAARVALDYAEYDVEGPAEIVGITQDPAEGVIDATAESLALSLWLERTLRVEGSAHELFLGAGAGVATIDVSDVDGPVQGGGTFDVRTEADTEYIVSLALGYRWHLGEHWLLEALARQNHHFADWQLEDRVSGARGSIDDYSSTTLTLGVGFGL
jgi:hypothetical protein